MKPLIFCLFLLVGGAGSVLAQKTAIAEPPKISNGIKINASAGIKLTKAYLFYDGGTRVSDSNKASLNQNVNILVQIERGGWTEREGKVTIGASEKILTNTGLKILDEKDLFATLADISADDAQYVTLKAVITSMKRKFGYFLVSFTIWDKWGPGKITGSYRLYIR
jgi:hypothetical protein